MYEQRRNDINKAQVENLTNNQKIEYIRKLIQKVEWELESNKLNEKLTGRKNKKLSCYVCTGIWGTF